MIYMNKMKTLLFFLAGLFCFFFSSCMNLFEQEIQSHEEISADGKTYLNIICSTTTPSSRTIFPQALTAESLSDFTLKGIMEGTDKEVIFFNAADYTTIPSKITIDAGIWNLNLSAKYSSILFMDAKKVEIVPGSNNPANFVLKATETYGGYEIVFDLSGTENVTYAQAVLKAVKIEGTFEPVTEKYGTIEGAQPFTNDKKMILKRDLADPESRIQSGLYLLSVGFYADVNDTTPINNWENYIAIKEGYKTEASFNLAFNDVYSITYQDLDTGEAEIASGLLIRKYSARSSFTLPVIRKTSAGDHQGDLCSEWIDFDTGNSISTIKAGTTGNKVLTPHYRSTLFVSATGDDTNGTGSYDNPLLTIDGACDKILENGAVDKEWSICIDGEVTGRHTSGNYGRTEIPSTITTSYAKSILLMGYNGLENDGTPRDMINRGLNSHNTTSATDTGTVLAIATPVPVTIKNLKISNSRNNSSNGSSDPYHQKGGGISIAEGATVTLSDGVLIIENTASYGGGVYNAGTLYINGSAVIGDKSANEIAHGYDAGNSVNYGSSGGGGIYNTNKLYLGYSNYLSESENTPEEWTGGIYYNYTIAGGAIYNTNAGEIVFNSGTLKFNASGGSGSGGGAIYNYGSLLMKGGIIESNKANSTSGGGILNSSNTTNGPAYFTFAGGTIKGNQTTGSGRGGGVYNSGVMYVYGKALIGDKYASGRAGSSSECSNYSENYGGGLFVAGSDTDNVNGKVYLGYKSYTSESENEPESWTGGIYYNYSNVSGGGLGTDGKAKVIFNSGTIANNGAAKKGNGIYLYTDNFVLCGNPVISNENENTRQDILYFSSKTLKIGDSLSNIPANHLYIIPNHNEEKTKYYDTQAVIALTEGAQAAGLSIADVKNKFVIEPLEAAANGVITQWYIKDDGKVAQNISNLYVSATGSDSNDGLTLSTALASISAAVSKMNDPSKDYTIYLNGEVTGPQYIKDTSTTQKIQAGSIRIEGKNTSNNMSYLPTDILNGNFSNNEEGSTLTVNTAVPVTLYGIIVKGGHGTVKDGKVIGGGVLIEDGATVSVEYNTRILGNQAYFGNTHLPGYGAGVYVSNNAKLYINSSSHVTENIATCSGAGIYVADGGYLRTQTGSGSYITLNTFNEDYRDANGYPANPCGAGVFLEDNSTFEMFGCYVRVNSIPDNGLGSGIYVSKNADFKLSGAAEVTIPNDVYLQNNVQIDVVDSINSSPAFRITPEYYPVDGGADVCLIKRSKATASSLASWSTIASRFEITPQTLAGGEKQYWDIDNSTSDGATGKLIKQAGMGLTINIQSDLSSDIEVTVTSGGLPVANNTHLVSGSTLVFTATAGMASYTWKLDGQEVSTTNTLELNTSNFASDPYDLYLEAVDSNGDYYSYTAQINVSQD